jgi:hypothetical protein
MSPIRLIHGAAFDPETVHTLALAYEHACASIRSDDVSVRETIARRIIEAGRRGERDVKKLAANALEGLGGIAEAG